MANRKHGLGIDPRSDRHITPCPRMIDSYFRYKIGYTKYNMVNKLENQFLVKYQKTINICDNPEFPDLRGLVCTSIIIVDYYYGNVVDHYFKINKGKAIRSFAALENEHLIYLFKYHLNLTHLTREYLKGGWLKTTPIINEIKKVNEHYRLLTEDNIEPTHFLKITKPEHTVGVFGKKRAPEKESYLLKPDFPMYDMSFCMANCKKDCARKKIPAGIHTVSDFTNVCLEYEENKENKE